MDQTSQTPKSNDFVEDRIYLHCDSCGFRKVISKSEADETLYEMPMSPVPGGRPKQEKGKIVAAKSTDQPSRYRCPNCGFAIVSKRLPPAYKKVIKQSEKIEAAADRAERARIQSDRIKSEQKQIERHGDDSEDYLARHQIRSDG